MPDRRRHRGPHPEDRELFAPGWVTTLRTAVAELSWLLSRGYSDAAAVKLVGDRHQLAQRQRTAVRRATCSDGQRDLRAARRVPLAALAGAPLTIDGFNVLTTVEAALAGGVLFRGRDGCTRDMASMHGSWRRVAETETAVGLVLDVVAEHGPGEVRVLLDRPVANSGRLAGIVRLACGSRLARCTVELSDHVDRDLMQAPGVVATADSAVLDAAAVAVDLVAAVLHRLSPIPAILDLA